MNGNIYSNEQLTKIRHAERIAEADAYRMAKQVEQSNASDHPTITVTFRSFSRLRQLILRLTAARA